MIEKQKNAKETLFHILPQTEIEDIGANGVNEAQVQSKFSHMETGKNDFFPIGKSYSLHLCSKMSHPDS